MELILQPHLSNNPPPLRGPTEKALWAVGVRRTLGGGRNAGEGYEQVDEQREGGDRRRAVKVR